MDVLLWIVAGVALVAFLARRASSQPDAETVAPRSQPRSEEPLPGADLMLIPKEMLSTLQDVSDQRVATWLRDSAYLWHNMTVSLESGVLALWRRSELYQAERLARMRVEYRVFCVYCLPCFLFHNKVRHHQRCFDLLWDLALKSLAKAFCPTPHGDYVLRNGKTITTEEISATQKDMQARIERYRRSPGHLLGASPAMRDSIFATFADGMKEAMTGKAPTESSVNSFRGLGTMTALMPVLQQVMARAPAGAVS